MSLTDLPLLNALLNSTSTVFLLFGYYHIRHRRKISHHRAMLGALIASSLFLISYLVYHYNVGSIKFQGQGGVRLVYFTILITHTILAATVPALASITLLRALRERFDRHRKIARWTLPIWLYVSITGVIVYLMLYQLYPAASGP